MFGESQKQMVWLGVCFGKIKSGAAGLNFKDYIFGVIGCAFGYFVLKSIEFLPNFLGNAKTFWTPFKIEPSCFIDHVWKYSISIRVMCFYEGSDDVKFYISTCMQQYVYKYEQFYGAFVWGTGLFFKRAPVKNVI